jgi:hypothetical protein
MLNRIGTLDSRVAGSLLSLRYGSEIRSEGAGKSARQPIISYLNLEKRAVIIIAAFSSFASAQAQILTLPPPPAETVSGNFNAITVNNGGQLTLTSGSVFPGTSNGVFGAGTVTVNSGGSLIGGTLTGTILTLLPNGGSTALTVNSGVAGVVAKADLTNSAITAPGGGNGVDVMATSSGVATVNLNGVKITLNGAIGVNVTTASSGSATATLTGTTIDLGNPGGKTALAANGPGSTITFGAGSSVTATGGGGGVIGVKDNGGTITFMDGAFVNMPGGGDSSQVQADMGGTFDMTGGSLIVSGGGGNGIRAGDDSTDGIVNLDGTQVEVLGSGGNSVGVWANLPGSQANLTSTNITLGGPGGGNFGIKATSGASATSNGGSVLVDATGGHNIGVGGSIATLELTSVTVTGSNASVGLQADGASSVLSANNSFVAAAGDDDIGALAQNGGAIGTRNETITVNGNNPTGVQLRGT